MFLHCLAGTKQVNILLLDVAYSLMAKLEVMEGVKGGSYMVDDVRRIDRDDNASGSVRIDN